ncbi:hypothetical protein HYW76_00425 [Candidatus Pacearchaeota archaeon]|nr:hypothetical protein [Candidatus Pacearchaeota archaeon]
MILRKKRGIKGSIPLYLVFIFASLFLLVFSFIILSGVKREITGKAIVFPNCPGVVIPDCERGKLLSTGTNFSSGCPYSIVCCGNGQCETGETLINCAADCSGTNPPSSNTNTLSISLVYPPNNQNFSSLTNYNFMFLASDGSGINKNVNCSFFVKSIFNQSARISINPGSRFNVGTALEGNGVFGYVLPSFGSYNWQIKCKDDAGNEGVSETRAFSVVQVSNVDTTPPTITLVYPAVNNQTFYSTSNNFAFKTSDLIFPTGISCNLFLDSGLVKSMNVNNSQLAYSQINTSFGSHSWQVKCRNSANNEGASPLINFNVVNYSQIYNPGVNCPSVTPPSCVNGTLINMTASFGGCLLGYTCCGNANCESPYESQRNCAADCSGQIATPSGYFEIVLGEIEGESLNWAFNQPLNFSAMINSTFPRSSFSCGFYVDNNFYRNIIFPDSGTKGGIIKIPIDKYAGTLSAGIHTAYARCGILISDSSGQRIEKTSQVSTFSVNGVSDTPGESNNSIPPAVLIVSPINDTYPSSSVLVDIRGQNLTSLIVYDGASNNSCSNISSCQINGIYPEGSYHIISYGQSPVGVIVKDLWFSVNSSYANSSVYYDQNETSLINNDTIAGNPQTNENTVNINSVSSSNVTTNITETLSAILIGEDGGGLWWGIIIFVISLIIIVVGTLITLLLNKPKEESENEENTSLVNGEIVETSNPENGTLSSSSG